MVLKITKARYFDPNLDPKNGTDVTSELSSQIRDGRLFYQGIYNSIFPDHFKGIRKRLKIELSFNHKNFVKFYNEDDKIDLPSDLGENTKKWWEKTWVQVIFLLGAVAGLIALFR